MADLKAKIVSYASPLLLLACAALFARNAYLDAGYERLRAELARATATVEELQASNMRLQLQQNVNIRLSGQLAEETAAIHGFELEAAEHIAGAPDAKDLFGIDDPLPHSLTGPLFLLYEQGTANNLRAPAGQNAAPGGNHAGGPGAPAPEQNPASDRQAVVQVEQPIAVPLPAQRGQKANPAPMGR